MDKGEGSRYVWIRDNQRRVRLGRSDEAAL